MEKTSGAHLLTGAQKDCMYSIIDKTAAKVDKRSAFALLNRGLIKASTRAKCGYILTPKGRAAVKHF